MKVRSPRKNRTHLLLFVLLLPVYMVCLQSSPGQAVATATEQTISPSEQTEDAGQIDENPPPLLDITQQKATVMLIDAADWFDSFFEDSRFSDEQNRSRAKLRLELEYHDTEGWELSPTVRWRIHLPRLSKKANLLIFAKEDPEDDTSADIERTGVSEDTLNESLAAALQYYLKTTEKLNISTTFGGSFDYLYAGLRFRYYQDMGSWQGRFVERVRYYTDDGWENYLSLDLERHVSEKWLFRTTGLMYTRESEDNLEHYLNFQLYQFLTRKKAISYEWVNKFMTEPSYDLENLTLRMRYRQQFLREWLLYEIAPEVNFPEKYDRQPKFGITFTLEAKFGYLSGRQLRNIFQF